MDEIKLDVIQFKIDLKIIAYTLKSFISADINTFIIIYKK